MPVSETDGGRGRLVSALLAVVLTIVSIRSLKNGKRKRGLLSGVGALACGFVATTGGDDEFEAEFGEDFAADTSSVGTSDDESSTSTETTTETTDADTTGGLTCAACGEPIVLGQRRGPNDEDDIVHDDCK